MLQAFAELRKLHSLFNEAEKWLNNQLGTPICVPNCGICCERNTIPCHSIEASLLVSFMVGQAKIKYIDAARSWLLDQDPHVTVYEGVPQGLITGRLREEWGYLSTRPCILLDHDKRCSVHIARPLVCRAYGVTKLPERYCPRPLGRGENRDGKMLIPDEAATILREQVDLFLQRTKARNITWIKQGFLPTMIFRKAREQEFRDLIADNKIASAKLIGLDYSVQALWQDASENFVKV